MSTNSGIEWTDATWNPVTGCTRVSAGCDHCYAVAMTHRLEAMGQKKYAGLTVLNPRGERHFNGQVRCHREALELPFTWKTPRRVFVNSMSDLFHPAVPFPFVAEVFTTMAQTSRHTYQVLTKRPERAAAFYRWNYQKGVDAGAMTWADAQADWLGSWANVWIGTSVENQTEAEKRIPELLKCPAAVTFLSCEPLLGAVRISEDWFKDRQYLPRRPAGIDWIIVGGESGPGARPLVIDHVRSLVGHSRRGHVPVFVKQLGARPCYSIGEHTRANLGTAIGEILPDTPPDTVPLLLRDPKGGDPAEWPEDLRVREMPGVSR